MNPCEDCLYFRICFERRGICTEYKTLEMIRNEIKMLNENQKASAEAAGHRAELSQKAVHGDRGRQVYQSASIHLPSDTSTNSEAAAEEAENGLSEG
jgi:hypothetical protein